MAVRGENSWPPTRSFSWPRSNRNPVPEDIQGTVPHSDANTGVTNTRDPTVAKYRRRRDSAT